MPWHGRALPVGTVRKPARRRARSYLAFYVALFTSSPYVLNFEFDMNDNKKVTMQQHSLFIKTFLN